VNTSESASKPVAAVVGVGPGLGAALVRRYTAEGYAVAAIARRADALADIISDVADCRAYVCDTTDTAQVNETHAAISRELGPIDALLYNAGGGTRGTVADIDAEAFAHSWQVNALGLFNWAKVVTPAMIKAERGIIGVTGATASLRGKAFTTGFASAKAAQRSLAQSLARDLGPTGVHVFYAIIDGGINNPNTRTRDADKPAEGFLSADDIADTYWALTCQKRSAWTFEIDLRPHVETW
jgi:NAD(P)-dependent dehydrogenase (short-subunit alcohol dehydrogenase family)